MYLSLKGSLGHTPITDRVGESLLQIAEGASAAYSLRNLGSDSPSVVRVRRESDNAERDFTAQDINTSVVENWVGAGNNGFVETWYDQSGNGNDASQLTASQQPKIVDTGVKVAGGIDFDGINDYFQLDLGADLAQPNSFFMSQTSDTTSSVFNEFFDTTAGTPRTLLDQGSGYRLTAGVNLEDASFTAETNRVLFSAFANSTSSFIGKNGVSSAVGDAGTEGINQFSSIAKSGIRYYDGKMDEFIIYNSDESAKRAAIENNIDNYYGITSAGSYVNAAGDSYINAAGDTYLQP